MAEALFKIFIAVSVQKLPIIKSSKLIIILLSVPLQVAIKDNRGRNLTARCKS